MSRRRQAVELLIFATTALLLSVMIVAGARNDPAPDSTPVTARPALSTSTSLASTTSTPSPTTIPAPTTTGYMGAADWPVWLAIGMCEQPGPAGEPDWTHRGPTYPGGLGVHRDTWTSFGGTDFAPTADLASPSQQIEVARRIRARHGLAAWSCGRHLFPGG